MFELPPDTYVSHLSTGRVRIKIPSHKKKGNYFASLQEQFSGLPGVTSIEVNPLTGSVLLLHSLDEATVRDFLQCYNLAGQTSDNKPAASAVHGEVATIFRGWDRQIQDFSRGTLNLEALVAISLIGGAVYQISRGRFMMLPWYNALWYAFSLFKG